MLRTNSWSKKMKGRAFLPGEGTVKGNTVIQMRLSEVPWLLWIAGFRQNLRDNTSERGWMLSLAAWFSNKTGAFISECILDKGIQSAYNQNQIWLNRKSCNPGLWIGREIV